MLEGDTVDYDEAGHATKLSPYKAGLLEGWMIEYEADGSEKKKVFHKAGAPAPETPGDKKAKRTWWGGG